MALRITHNTTEFGIGDRVRVSQKIKEGEKFRVAVFEGMVIKIRGVGGRKMFTIRRIGETAIGIERIFPVDLPTIERIEVVKKGTMGVNRAKLYYTREKSTKEIDKIYSRAKRREMSKATPASPKVSRGKKKTSVKSK